MVTVAFAQWEDRIAPVFDTARKVCIVVVDSGRVVSEAEETLPADSPLEKSGRLAELGVDVLVCGAISRPLRQLVAAYGIAVTPFVTGRVREVIPAWLKGRLSRAAFVMPGCGGHGRRRRRGRPAGPASWPAETDRTSPS